MTTDITLSNYATAPLYNIKAVVQMTNTSSSTLRAWERRYNMCSPQRSESGYRLYSDRDVAVIRWLRMQVDAGMSISHAVSWYESIIKEASTLDEVILPAPVDSIKSTLNGSSTSNHLLAATPTKAMQSMQSMQPVRSFDALQEELINALLQYDEESAEQSLTEAFELYSVTEVGEQLITPVLVEIGERWHRGELSITNEHYATSYLRQRLFGVLRMTPNPVNGFVVWTGCGPGEMHEIGALLLSIHLRRAGYRVHYFGQNLPVDDFVNEVREHQPAMVTFSASTLPSAERLQELIERLTELSDHRPIIGYGGRAFSQHPELRNAIQGIYLGESMQEAVQMIHRLLLGEQQMPVLS